MPGPNPPALHRSLAGRLGAAAILVALGACGGESSLIEPADEAEPGAVSGELALYIADFEDGRTELRYVLRDAAGEEQKLVFKGAPDVEPGARVHIWGQRSGDAIEVMAYKLARRQDPSWIGSQSSALVDEPPAVPRVECPVLVRINGVAGPANINLDSIEQQFHTGPKSINAFYRENSYGKNTVLGKTYGPFDYAMTGCNYSALAKALTPMIPMADGCKQYGWVMVPEQASCDWSGLASGGSPLKPARDTWFNASIGCVVTVQEPGHNYGLDHSSTLTCTNGWFSDDLATCKHNEYGDRFDPMGNGCRHMNVWQKQYSQWFGKCNAIKVRSTGTFNLLPTELACDGVQSIQLPFPAGKIRSLMRPGGGGDDAGSDPISSYFLEYRTSNGVFDTGMTPQVLVHVGLEPPPPSGATKFGPHTWLLDASVNRKNGSIGAQPGMVAGGSFSDPAGGLTVTVTSLDPDKAVIQVDYAGGTEAPTCIDATPIVAPGPAACTGSVVGSDGGVVPPPTGAGGAGGGSGGAGVRDAGRDAPSAGGAGTAGAASDAGAVVTGGAAGASGADAGAAGSGGGPSQPSTTGSTTVATGAGGSTGFGGNGSAATTSHAKLEDVDAGCACRVGAPRGVDLGRGGWLVLGLGALLPWRRRHRKS